VRGAGNVIRRRPATSFLVLAFTISYIAGLPFNFAVTAVAGLSDFWASYLPRLVTVLGPSVAAVVVARAGAGGISVANLIGSLGIRSRYVPWLAVIVIVGLAAAFSAFSLAGVSTSELFGVVRAAPLMLAAHFIMQAAIVGVGEELGWRGWLLPYLSSKHSFASATALTGLAWTVWHMPVFLSGVALALSFFALLVALSGVHAWLWVRTQGSVGVVALAHASVNAPFFFLESAVRTRSEGTVIATKAFGYLSVMYLCLAVVLMIAFRHIWLSHREKHG